MSWLRVSSGVRAQFSLAWRRTLSALVVIPTASLALCAESPLAHFKFEGNAVDSVNPGVQAELKNTQFRNRSLFLNGNYEFGGNRSGYRANTPITGLSYEAFTVCLDFCPVDLDSSSRTSQFHDVLNTLSLGLWERVFEPSSGDHGNILTGGSSYRWLGFNHRGGHLNLTLNNQTFTHSFTNAVISPKQWHRLVCSFDLRQRRILTFLDDAALESIQLPNDFHLEIVGSADAASDKVFTFVNYANGSVFHGYVGNLKVFGRALDGRAIASLDPTSPRKAGTMGSALLLPLIVTLLLTTTVLLRMNRKGWKRNSS